MVTVDERKNGSKERDQLSKKRNRRQQIGRAWWRDGNEKNIINGDISSASQHQA